MRRIFVFFACGAVACGGGAPSREASAPTDAKAPQPPAADAQAPPAAEPPPPQAAPEGLGAEAPPPDAEVRSSERERPETVEEALTLLDREAARLDRAVTTAALSDGCGRACRALRSMRRAADGLCELTGEDDVRCDRARGRVERGERRVKEAGCSC